MDKNMFATIMPILIGGLLNMIISETDVDEDEAIAKLYNSELYAAIENEETKVWTYSVPMLFDLYISEATTGKLELPVY